MPDNSDSSDMRMVVIDDDAMILQSLKTALGDFGFDAKTFQDPLRALEWIKANGVDIVISDICMPGVDGFEVLKRVKDIDPHAHLIFITAHGQLDTAIRALREGATDFFEKPFTISSLRAAIERTSRFRMLTQQKELLSNQLDTLSSELITRGKRQYTMLGQSPAMKALAEQIIDLAASNATVLITGESGTGKELTANAIHASSPRREKPFLAVNCPSIPEDLFESEMFGHRRGSFTGAIESRGGYLKAAEGGTLFLDEVGDLPMRSQAKILRLLEQKTYLPIGEHEERTADVRILAATNQSLESLVKEKKFREDLFYRLSVCSLRQPALRERKADIPLLAVYFTLQFASEMGKAIDGIDDEALSALTVHDYPGNVRELRNAIESSIIHCHHSGLLRKDDMPEFVTRHCDTEPSPAGSWPMETIRLEDVEKRLYTEALNRTANNISAASRLLGLSRGKLRRRLAELKMPSEGHQ